MSIKGILEYLRIGLWRVRLRELHPGKSFLLRLLRIVVLSVKSFDEDKCTLRASALTFFTLLSIVPVCAMVFAVAKGFGFERSMEAKILEFAEGQEEAVERIIEFSRNLLENTSGGLIAGAGVILLVWSVVKLLGNIELSFNEIWGIKRSRSWLRRVSDYLFFVIVAPVFFMTASSATVVIASEVQALSQESAFFETFGHLALLALRLLPFFLAWTLFIFMYMFMPNCKVRFAAALLGGVVAGSLFQLAQWGYIAFQVGVTKYGAIYGSFAALPLFLIWLNMSWLIVLYGAELSFARQHVDTYEFEPDCLAASPSLRKLLSLGVVHTCVKRFEAQETPSTSEELSTELGTPVRLMNELIDDLVRARVLSEVLRNRGERGETVAYQPAIPLESLSVQAVLDHLDERGQSHLPLRQSEALDRIAKSLDSLRRAAAAADSNHLLKDL